MPQLPKHATITYACHKKTTTKIQQKTSDKMGPVELRKGALLTI
jgi:hypothetical protein